MDKQKLGAKGEEKGAQFLKRQGYKILCRNFKTRVGKIDIIAEHKKEIVFIEVKTRSSLKFGYPEEAVTNRKKKHLFKASQYYLLKSKTDKPYRYEILAVMASQEEYLFNIVPIE